MHHHRTFHLFQYALVFGMDGRNLFGWYANSLLYVKVK